MIATVGSFEAIVLIIIPDRRVVYYGEILHGEKHYGIVGEVL
jgi:hypothetical protein